MFYGDYTDSATSPLFPFGHGLSYATFERSEPRVEASGTTAEPVVISLTTRNTSERSGVDVVQLFVNDDVASVARHQFALCGFARVPLGPGEAANGHASPLTRAGSPSTTRACASSSNPAPSPSGSARPKQPWS